MVIGNMLSDSGQQYVATKDDKNTWRILDTWHAELKQMSADDDIPDDSPAVVALSTHSIVVPATIILGKLDLNISFTSN